MFDGIIVLPGLPARRDWFEDIMCSIETNHISTILHSYCNCTPCKVDNKVKFYVQLFGKYKALSGVRICVIHNLM